MGELGLSGPLAVESSVAYYLHPNQHAISASTHISLPSKMDRLTASTYQHVYKYAAQSVWQKTEVIDAPYDPCKGLFRPAQEKMRETSTLRKQEDEVFNQTTIFVVCNHSFSRLQIIISHETAKVQLCTNVNCQQGFCLCFKQTDLVSFTQTSDQVCTRRGV